MINKQYIESLEEPEWLKTHKLKNFEVFSNLDTPKFFKYGISLVLYLNNFNFEFDKVNSKIKVDKEEFISNIEELKEHLKIEDDKFSSFHNAFLDKILVLKVPKNKEATINIDLTLENVGSDFILLIAEENSKVNILQKEYGDGIARFGKVKVIAKENSEVNYIIHQNFTNLKNFFWIEGEVEKDARLNWFTATLGSSFTKLETLTNLNGEGSESKTYGMFLGTNDQQFDIYSVTKHNAKNATSNMFTRGVVKDKSKALYRGLVNVGTNAFGTNGYQKEDVLILSEDAEADAIPNLEINNNEVKCSHGVSIGKIDEEQIFYLMSRGIPENEAKKEIIEGFFYPVTKDFNLDLTKEVKERL